MTYNFFNKNNGDAFSMQFDNERKKDVYVSSNPNLVCLGEQEFTLPTRHVRMQNKEEEFAGWGS